LTREERIVLNLTPAQTAKVAAIVAGVKGSRIDVRTDAHTKHTGIVDVVEPAYWGDRRLVFRVELLCGSAQVRKEFFLSTFNSAR
jgi:hypothetical protein